MPMLGFAGGSKAAVAMAAEAEKMKLYGLTGGIASGKSAAAARFVLRGVPVIDADLIGHEVIAPGGAAEEKVLAAFGRKILSCGKIDREKLGALVFRNEAARAQLNAVVHPAIFEEVGRRCAMYAEQGHAAVIVDAALICEEGRKEPWLSGLILILASAEVRLERMVRLRNMTREEGLRRITAQTPPENKIPCADWMIENNGSLDQFQINVDKVIEEVIRAAG